MVKQLHSDSETLEAKQRISVYCTGFLLGDFILSYQETILFTIDPHCGNLNKLP